MVRLMAEAVVVVGFCAFRVDYGSDLIPCCLREIMVFRVLN